MECLICTDSISHARMGVNACRACAAFFKRTNGKFCKLKCKGGEDKCRDENPKTTCRKCRLTRFREVLEKAREKSTDEDEKMEETQRNVVPSSPFVDHTSFYDCEPSGSNETPLLDRIRKGYSLLCLIRKAGELAMKADRGDNEGDIRVDNLVLTRAERSLVVPFTNIAKEGVVEFGNLAFAEFRALDESTKKLIVDSSYSVVHTLETTYRLCHHFPGDEETTLVGYSIYFRSDELDRFFANRPEGLHKANLIREVKRSLAQSTNMVRKQFESVKPSDFEFLSLYGLAFWSDKVMEHGEPLTSLANRIRSEIMRELHCYYATSGIADYASRVGHLFCLLNEAAKKTEDFYLFRLMSIFDTVDPSN